jgi:hypothetical protein
MPETHFFNNWGNSNWISRRTATRAGCQKRRARVSSRDFHSMIRFNPKTEVQFRIQAFGTTEPQSSVSDSEHKNMAKPTPLGRNAMESKNH